MKKLILATCLALCSLVHAGEIILSDKNVSYGETFLSGTFQINESLGRAWVEISYGYGDPEAMPDNKRIQVKGLAFDKTTNDIFLETETGRIVCAYQKIGLFGIKSIRPTGNCKFKRTYYTVTRDNGFEIEEIEKQKVSLLY
jgi:hypothetical protein